MRCVKATLFFERDPRVLQRLREELRSTLSADDWQQLPSTVRIPHPYLKPAFYSFSPRSNRAHPVATRTYRLVRMHRLMLTEAEAAKWSADRSFRKQVWQTEIGRGYVEFELVDGD
ncbi:MAG: hypothetical protein HYX94_13740 [Chloroflexi bacterium]|nr:hypothetical protein [Chloroflexota bacterium]